MAIKNTEVLRIAERPRWTEADARTVLGAMEEAGQSVSEFARQYGLDPQRVWRWRGRIDGGATKSGTTEPMTFVPVTVTRSSREIVVVVRIGSVQVDVVDPSAVEPGWLAALLDAVVDSTGRGL